ncbi:MAG: hypothetical protein EOO61_07940 [Hymenobacter sp.]|nr:MAG: hypothetical protein EOO61_07940 [Hymenobacter sp.]
MIYGQVDNRIRCMPKRILYEKELLDKQTGELLQTYTEAVVPKEPDFIKLYLDDIGMLKNIPTWTNSVLFELLKLMSYKNQIVLNSTVKHDIASDLGIATKSVDNALGLLVKQGVLTRRGTGVYIASPMLFGKGEWKDIRKLRLTIEYSKEGRKLTTEVQREGDSENLEIIEKNDALLEVIS